MTSANLPFYFLSRLEKRTVVRPAFPEVKGATVRLDNPLGFQIGLLVLAHRVGILPNVGDVLRLSRGEESHEGTPGWMLTLEPYTSPHNSREHLFNEPWAVERINRVEGLLRLLDPKARPDPPAGVLPNV